MTINMPEPNDFATRDGLELATYSIGDHEGMPPIVLQHGFSSSTYFEWVECGVIDAILSAGRKIVALDARGHGRSDKPHDTSFYGGEFMPNDLMDFVTSLGFETYDLVGFSMGGAIAASVAAKDKRVRRVVISGVGGRLVTGDRPFDPKDMAEGMRADTDDGLPDFIRNMRTGAIMRKNDMLALAAHTEAGGFGRINVGTITAKALVMAGDTDPVATKPELLANAIPGAKLVIVPGDHWHSKRSPEFSAALAEFLS